MAITIYTSRQHEIEKKLNSLAKKAEACGVKFSYSFTNPHKELIQVYQGDRVTHIAYHVNSYFVDAIDLEISEDSIVRSGNWFIKAMIEHGENGHNVVTPFTDESDESWRTIDSNCDHCKTNRFRKVTFIVENDKGEIKQVGKSCLREYTGIDPQLALCFAQINNTRVIEDKEYYEDDLCYFNSLYHSVETVLAAAVMAIKKYGYVKSDEDCSTKYRVKTILSKETIDEESYKMAENVKKWLLTQLDSKSDFIYNMACICENGFVEEKDIGRMVYAPVAYQKDLARKAEVANTTSTYVGNIGDRLTVKMASAEYVKSWETAYGITHFYRFSDEKGNKYVWYASTMPNVHPNCTVRFTVKNFSDRNGVKQTVITRCKIA